MKLSLKSIKPARWHCLSLAALLATGSAMGQSTTIGGGGFPVVTDMGYVSDYSPDGLFILSDGISTLQNNSTWEHGNTLMDNLGMWTGLTGSIDRFVAAGINTISGSNAPIFYNADFSNGANTTAVTNSNGINISNRLDFNNAITTTVRSNTATGAVHFADNATYTNSALGDAQHVNGYVSKAGNDAFTYPVGSGTDLRMLNTSAPATPTDEYSVAWIVNDPNTNGDPSNGNAFHPRSSLGPGVGAVSPVGQWDWIAVNGTGAGLTINVSIPDVSSFSYTPALILVGWNGTQWVNLSTGPTPYNFGGSPSFATNKLENSLLQGTMIPGIQAIGIGTTGFILPVTLLEFSATKQGNNAMLSWVTTTEQNTASFIVERSDAAQTRWTVIGTVAAAGNSSTTLRYTLPDLQVMKGGNYYRLRTVDKDGSFTLSPIRMLSFGNGNLIVQVFPNPVKAQVTVSGLEAGMTLRLVTLTGQLIRTQKTNGPIEQFQMGSLQAGLYILELYRDGQLVQQTKLIKE